MIDVNENMLKQAASGDADAFEKIIFQYEKLIFNIAYRMMGNVEDAKDISQEVILKIYKNIGKCTDIKYIKSWICTITNNTCIDEIRKRKGKHTDSYDAMVETEEGSMGKQIESDEPAPDEVALKRERNVQIQKAINQLSPEHRTLIVLRDINGLRYDEIAKISDTALGTVKSRISRARNYLKNNLKNWMEQNKL